MTSLNIKKEIHNIEEGAISFYLHEVIKNSKNNILYVARDEINLKRILNNIKFFSDIEIITLPEWNSLPYDRSSPLTSIVSERVESLSNIIQNNNQKLIITTARNIIQKTIPKDILKKQVLTIKKDDVLIRDELIEFLISSGFKRVTTSIEPGDFSVRGSIIDILTNRSELGYRIDFFGKTVESIKLFDPVTQISKSFIESINLIPVNEIIFNDENITRFKGEFIENFGLSATKNVMYESISVGNYYPGIENWLPLFYPSLDSIFNYIDNPIIIFEHLTNEIIFEQEKTIKDYFDIRINHLAIKNSLEEDKYYPVKPDKMWIKTDELEDIIKSYRRIYLNPFVTKDTESPILPDFISESKQNNKTSIEIIREFARGENNLKKSFKIVIVYTREASKTRIINILQSLEYHYILVNSYDELSKISPKTIGLVKLDLEDGFIFDKYLIVSEQILFGEKIYQKNRARKRIENYLSEAASLVPGEIIVHKEHGIGKFEGLETLKISNNDHDCLKITYQKGDKLYIPVENIDLIKRYGSEGDVVLDKLGSIGWQSRKAKLKNRIKLAASEILKISAERQLKPAQILLPHRELYDEFCEKFPYAETEDQMTAIREIEDDLSSGVAMDRLICGDVGFGKTEIALRAAFIANNSYESLTGENKIQVAIVVPTTLLARQHYNATIERFKDFDVSIGNLSRLTSSKEAKRVKEGLASGKIDIVIGTHALLSKNIEFKNLGLLIIDEEQHFGVAQKEQIKKLKSNIHVLTLSATPIPRTLQMSLFGIKELSLIATPPVDRLAVTTYVTSYDSVMIREAILREFYRGGKIFYVAPKIKHLADIEKELKSLVPEIKIVMAHGQMPANNLDNIMTDFYDGKYHLLLSTTIVESGLDVPLANTIIIHRADTLGLSQLYQLRGRVGRGKIKAFAYLTLPPRKTLKDDALRRLKVMQNLDSLGAGFSIASSDMDIRGFGNLVGEEQSGHVREVGIELYQDMLKEAIESLKDSESHKEVEDDFSTQINIGLPVLIPTNYVSDESLRLGLYRRVALLGDNIEIDNFISEMIDRFGPLPDEFNNLLLLIRLKKLCAELMVTRIDAGPKGIVLSFYLDKFPNPDALIDYIIKNSNKLKARADQKLVLNLQTDDPIIRFNVLNKFLLKLIALNKG